MSIDDQPYPEVAKTVALRARWSLGAFDNSAQQDAHEAFCLLMDSCESVDKNMLHALSLPSILRKSLLRNRGTNADRYSTPFWSALGGIQLTTTTCHACRRSSALYDIWHSLSLTVPEQTCTIEHLVGSYFSSTPLQDKCEYRDCEVEGRRVKSDALSRWPSVLVVHLKRWAVVSLDPFIRRKVPTMVSYETLFVVDVNQPAYHLRGVVEHHGDAGGGHYTSIVRAPDNFWYRCDDEQSPERVPTASALNAQAMILVYERT